MWMFHVYRHKLFFVFCKVFALKSLALGIIIIKMQKLTLVLVFIAMLSLATATVHKFKKLTPVEPLIPDTEVYKRLIVNPETLCSLTDILWCAEEIAGNYAQMLHTTQDVVFIYCRNCR
jgi:hypothetical protein